MMSWCLDVKAAGQLPHLTVARFLKMTYIVISITKEVKDKRYSLRHFHFNTVLKDSRSDS